MVAEDRADVAEVFAAALPYPEPLKQALSLLAALHHRGNINAAFRAMLREGVPQENGRHREVTEALLWTHDERLAARPGSRRQRRQSLHAATAGHHGRPPGRDLGSGKSEAALILAQRTMRAGKGRGLCFALPTRATADAMFARVAEILMRLHAGPPSLVPAHGRATLDARFRNIAEIRALDPDEPGPTDWLLDNRRRALLADVGVGTIDQALLAVARARDRLEVAQAAGHAWLEGQGARAGLALREAGVTAYAVRELPGRAGDGRISA